MTITRPPIQLLSAFEAAARLGSFKRAAEELHVTPSALSQAIRKLENDLDGPLFHRTTRKVELTEAGRSFHRLAADVLGAYRMGFERFARVFTRPTLRISMEGFIAYEVVLPALHEFHRDHPGIEIRIETGMSLVDLHAGSIDAAIRLGTGRWSGAHAWPLDTPEVTLVCSAALTKKRPIRSLDDLRRHTLIVARETRDDWKRAANAVGVEEIPSKDRLVLDSYLGAMVASEQGLGVALGVFPLMNAWVRQGRLTAPLPLRQATPERHYFVVARGRKNELPVRAFYGWLKKRFEAL